MGQEKDIKVKGAEKKNEGGEKKSDASFVLKLDLHCEGCAQKVRRFVRHTHGVEKVKSDCETGKLTIKGDVDPTWLRERVEIKTKKKVELISSPPKKDAAGDKKSAGDGAGDKKSGEKTEKKTEDKKADEKKPKEAPVSSVVALKIRMHCEGCALFRCLGYTFGIPHKGFFSTPPNHTWTPGSLPQGPSFGTALFLSKVATYSLAEEKNRSIGGGD